jgi:hypothetical protein
LIEKCEKKNPQPDVDSNGHEKKVTRFPPKKKKIFQLKIFQLTKWLLLENCFKKALELSVSLT